MSLLARAALLSVVAAAGAVLSGTCCTDGPQTAVVTTSRVPDWPTVATRRWSRNLTEIQRREDVQPQNVGRRADIKKGWFRGTLLADVVLFVQTSPPGSSPTRAFWRNRSILRPLGHHPDRKHVVFLGNSGQHGWKTHLDGFIRRSRHRPHRRVEQHL